MKYTIVAFTVEAKRPIEQTKPTNGDMPIYKPEYPEIDIPDNAIGVTLSEDVVTAIPQKDAQSIPAGMEHMMMPALLRKHTHMLCRVRYLVPVKPSLK